MAKFLGKLVGYVLVVGITVGVVAVVARGIMAVVGWALA